MGPSFRHAQNCIVLYHLLCVHDYVRFNLTVDTICFSNNTTMHFDGIRELGNTKRHCQVDRFEAIRKQILLINMLMSFTYFVHIIP